MLVANMVESAHIKLKVPVVLKHNFHADTMHNDFGQGPEHWSNGFAFVDGFYKKSRTFELC